jgi:hypothetical protein
MRPPNEVPNAKAESGTTREVRSTIAASVLVRGDIFPLYNRNNAS